MSIYISNFYIALANKFLAETDIFFGFVNNSAAIIDFIWNLIKLTKKKQNAAIEKSNQASKMKNVQI